MMDDVLFLAHRIPFPPDRGDKIRSFHMLKAIASRRPVHLVAFVDEEKERGHIAALREAVGFNLGEVALHARPANRIHAALRALWRGEALSLAFYRSAALQESVSAILTRRPVAAIFAFSSQMAPYVPSADQRFVMDFVDMDSAKFGDYARAGGVMAPVYAREERLLRRHEIATARHADASLFVSRAEAALFEDRTGCRGVMAVGNGIDLDRFRPDAVEPITRPGATILFTGQMDYRPNIEAVTAFARDVLPRVRAVRPDAAFVIAGRAPTKAVWRLAGPGVEVTGAVDDMRRWLAAADVVVAPLQIGRGIQNKVLEAMAMARPVVASRAAFTGIDAAPGEDLIVADGAAAQADAILRLLGDPNRAARIGRAARARMERGYDWSTCLAALAELLDPVCTAAA